MTKGRGAIVPGSRRDGNERRIVVRMRTTARRLFGGSVESALPSKMMAADPQPPERSPLAGVSRPALFASFLKMGLLGFGGVLPWARRVIVDERGWLDDREFAQLIGLCQVLPGPNVVNLAVIIGARTHGPVGSLIAVSGILFVPVALMLAIAAFYASLADNVVARNAIAGASSAAAGLIVGTALRLLLHARPPPRGLVTGATAFVAVGILQWPLLWVITVLIPAGIAFEWRASRPRAERE